MELIISQHALQQIFKRDISIELIKLAISEGELIKNYPDDKPYPSKLMLYFKNEMPLHIVIAENKRDNQIILITAYVPEIGIWNSDFKTKK